MPCSFGEASNVEPASNRKLLQWETTGFNQHNCVFMAIFHLLKNIIHFALLVLTGIYHYWIFFQGSQPNGSYCLDLWTLTFLAEAHFPLTQLFVQRGHFSRQDVGHFRRRYSVGGTIPRHSLRPSDSLSSGPKGIV